jgi:hypothetical protein
VKLQCSPVDVLLLWLAVNCEKSYNFVVQVFGEVSEWLKEHAWKVCVSQKGTAGSNPALSASLKEGNRKTVKIALQGTFSPFLFSDDSDAKRKIPPCGGILHS